jgi:hypothetical protein
MRSSRRNLLNFLKYYNVKVFQQKKITKHSFFYNYDKNNYQQQA